MVLRRYSSELNDRSDEHDAVGIVARICITSTK